MTPRRDGTQRTHPQGRDMRMFAIMGRLLDDLADMAGGETVVVYADDLRAIMKAAGGGGTMYARKPEGTE